VIIFTTFIGLGVAIKNKSMIKIDKSIPLEDIFVGSMPFLVALIVGTIILVIFPETVVWLPNLMY